MKTYVVITKDNNFVDTLKIKANSILEASTKAKNIFKLKYNSKLENIKVSLHNSDLNNHIDELLKTLYSTN